MQVAAVVGLVGNSSGQLPASAEAALQAASTVAAGPKAALPPLVESPAVSEDALAAPLPEKQPAKAHKEVSVEIPAKKDDAKGNKARKSTGKVGSRKDAASTETGAGVEASPGEVKMPKAEVLKRLRGAAATQHGTSESEADGAPAAAKRARRRSTGHEPVNISEERIEAGEAPQAKGVPPSYMHST